MSPSGTQPSSGSTVESKRWQALLRLLEDDDPTVFEAVKAELMTLGETIRPHLEPLALSSEPVLRRHAQTVLHQMGCVEADNRFLLFCAQHGEEFDVEQGTWLIARTRDPEINVTAYQAVLDSWAAELGDRIRLYRRGESILAVINEYLFDELGFRGNEANYYETENSYLHRVMDRRTGNPISMCLIYIFISRRLGLPVTGIGFPGHFLCRYQSLKEEYYIDVFNRGRLLRKRECIYYLKQNGLGFRDDFLVPVSSRRILMRICANLHQIQLRLDNRLEATRLQRYLLALAR